MACPITLNLIKSFIRAALLSLIILATLKTSEHLRLRDANQTGYLNKNARLLLPQP